MSAFIPPNALSSISGRPVSSSDPSVTPLNPPTRNSPHATPAVRMVAYPYTGSGYGAAGIPYAGDKVGQSFRQTTTEDIVATAASVPIFSTLVSLLRETGLDYELMKGGPFTVFAPTDTAFASLLEPHGFSLLAPLLRPENREELKKVLAYHVVPGAISAASIMAAGKVTAETAAGVPITAMGYGKKVSAGSANVVKADIPCTNGVIHVISSVLIPMTFEQQPAGPVKKNFFDSTVLDIYANRLTPRQALGIDPLPAGYDPGALAKFE
eukprot:GFKZ01003647.1.p2 GENE.GFKZ01003647.1~~GFKZ01003647.1.p2  ORF type:complete len:268 (+),score=35.52 GFKZ01003647.1:199-1002(+)